VQDKEAMDLRRGEVALAGELAFASSTHSRISVHGRLLREIGITEYAGAALGPVAD
jgi:hypothetical protein